MFLLKLKKNFIRYIYDDLRNTNNMFTVNAKPVLRFKKLCENNIKDGDVVQLIKLE